ncbi:MAG: pyruvate:ferredoxin (flavodoxin) oxidoreductase [Candidatus Omnitrophica bacterium]|nr:pyruvate:ferredoxin (flavodoxin) oxidoreductase [Candidatus Omnitrophota bacterium]MCG2710852.1 pyruvate:ferredoxin (flavodoxin) oxidoreductase [Candidatus Omnitrophota bacterium]
MARNKIVMDGNTAAAYVGHAMNEVCAIYPITPSSGIGEIADEKSAKGQKNIWGQVPIVSELQSEGGASGAVHGALTAGALTTTFTASQGLLLMLPNMFKIAGELTPAVFYVTARTLATHALSIFCDHSDIMAARSTGFGIIFASSVQEVMDLGVIAQAATLESRIPFIVSLDGFRTSHEIQKIEEVSFDDMRAMIKDEFITAHRQRALSPDRPTIKGTSQNPDVFFQERETVNAFYQKTPAIVQDVMGRFAKLSSRQYKAFDYVGAKDAQRIIIIMGSGAGAAQEAVDKMNSNGEKAGMIIVRLYRPFDVHAFIKAIPASTKSIAVLDRTKEPGAIGEPLYLDVRSAIGEAMEKGTAPFKTWPVIVGGRYGLGSKEFTSCMVKAVFDNLSASKPKNGFTVGIVDDVTNTSLEADACFEAENPENFRCMFWGLGADGTVGANKNSIKIIGELTDYNVQGFFVYDSKKAGSRTISHLRFGKGIINSTYLIQKANFIACHNFSFLEKYDMLQAAEVGATFLLASPFGSDEIWNRMPKEVQQAIIDKKLKFYVIKAFDLAAEIGLGARINVIMQTAFFKISNIIPVIKAVEAIKTAIKKTYGKKGDKIVEMNNKAVEAALKSIEEVKVPSKAASRISIPDVVSAGAPDFVKNVTALIVAGRGDELPVSAFPVDGTWPTATSQYEKRNIALQIPEWIPGLCIQCAQCSFVCPHGVIRMKIYNEDLLKNAPKDFKSIAAKGKGVEHKAFSLQIAPEDCTGCGACVNKCPVLERGEDKQPTGRKAINMVSQIAVREKEKTNFEFFLSLPDVSVKDNPFGVETLRGAQLMRPLFEFSGACAGCGETPYVKLLTQLYGERAIIANATGCSSIYGGNLPTTPYCVRADGKGPAWSNSLFEDNAEFGFGMRLAVDQITDQAKLLLKEIASGDLSALAGQILTARQKTHLQIEEQRERVQALKAKLKGRTEAKKLLLIVDYLVAKSVWILGGDGWAYDIGYGGLDHVLAQDKNINVLVLDTEVYSNTGGQMSKATPMGAIAKFAAAGKPLFKKDLGLLAATYGSIYVARVAMGANPAQTQKAFIEAEQFNGPSIIISYSHCIAHGINMTKGMDQQKKAVDCGYWTLFRFNPDLIKQGENPMQLDSKAPSIPLEDYIYNETRFKALKTMAPERAEKFLKLSQEELKRRFKMYEHLAKMDYSKE